MEPEGTQQYKYVNNDKQASIYKHALLYWSISVRVNMDMICCGDYNLTMPTSTV